MVLAIVCGLLFGVIGFVPLIFGLRLIKKMTRATNVGHAAVLLLFIFLSIVILFGSAVVVIIVARESALPFSLSEALSLSVTAIVYGIRSTFGDTRKRSH